MFFLRHRRGNSPLTLSSPISGACHFGPSSHSQLDSVQHGGSAVGHKCCSVKKQARRLCELPTVSVVYELACTVVRSASTTPAEWKGSKTPLNSDKGLRLRQGSAIRSLIKTVKIEQPDALDYIASYRTGWS